jgi:hypothetical protein
VVLDRDMAAKTGAKGRADRRKAAAYFEKLTSAAKSEEPPAFDVGRSAVSIIEHVLDDGTEFDDAEQASLRETAAAAVEDAAVAMVTMPQAKKSRPKKSRATPATELSPGPDPADDEDFDPAEYARRNGLTMHTKK